MSTMTHPHNIYIHVPFCISKCNYCAFFSRAVRAPDWDTYARGVMDELDYWARTLGRVRVPTIFFGGGTPSLMPVTVFEQIISKINSVFDIDEKCEITLESNPGTIDNKKLDAFINAGVNRLSVGVQSLDDNKLKFLGRRHSTHDAINLLNAANARGIRVSADFIYGLPGDSVDDVVRLCRNINKLGLQHCSMYELTIEAGTPFATMNLNMPSNDEMADMYDAIENTLNIPRYEVSNYAAPGNECRHNQNVWDGDAYIGIGCGAAGRILMDDKWYEQRGAGEQFEKLSDTARAAERVITGLRTMRGVALDNTVRKILNMSYLRKNPELVQINSASRIVATRDGMRILDDVIFNLLGEINAT